MNRKNQSTRGKLGWGYKMKRFGVLLPLVGLVLGSGTDSATAADARVVVVDPYHGMDWSTIGQYKGNLHTHTTQSDGRMPVSEVIDRYHELGYRILSITDHDRCTWPWTEYGRDPEELGMLAIAGNELSRHHHVNSLFTEFTTPTRNLVEGIRGAVESGGIVMMNHPAAHWSNDWVMPRGYTAQRARAGVALAEPLRGLTRGDFTVSTWFRTGHRGRNVLLGNYGGARGGSLNLELHTGNRVRIYLESGSGQVVEINRSAGDVDVNTRDGDWHFLAARREGAELSLFLNGRLVGKADLPSPEFDGFDLAGDTLFLGRDSRDGATILRGDLDLVRVWGAALSEDELTTLAAGNAPETAPLLEYTFETSGGAAVSVGADFRGTIDDVADKPTGAMNATVSGDGALVVVDDVAEVLRRNGASSHAMRFGVISSVPANVVGFYHDLFVNHPEMFGMEVLNGTRPLSEFELDRKLWDTLLSKLMPERPVWGTATDDMHSLGQLGRDWVMVLAESLDESSVRQALESGAFYFSSTRVRPEGSESEQEPPVVVAIEHDTEAGRITLRAEVDGVPVPDDAYTWISHGKVVHMGPAIHYHTADLLPSGARYLRAEISGEGGTTYTNPVGFAVAE